MTISKQTPEVKAAIVESVRNGAYAKHAAEAAGISERALYSWLETDEHFAAALASAKADRVNRGIRLIREAADRDWRAEAWLLERTMPDSFRESSAVEHSGSVSLEGVLAGGLDEASE